MTDYLDYLELFLKSWPVVVPSALAVVLFVGTWKEHRRRERRRTGKQGGTRR